MDTSKITLGARLRMLRTLAGLSLRQVEEVTGIKQSTLSRYERGTSHPRDPELRRLADLYEVTPDQLLGYREVGLYLNPSRSGEDDRPQLLGARPTSKSA